MVTVIHHMLTEQKIQMVMAILMDHIIDQIEIVPVETVDEGQPGPVAIAEADDALGLERDNPSGQECKDLMPFRPSLLYDCPGPLDSRNMIC